MYTNKKLMAGKYDVIKYITNKCIKECLRPLGKQPRNLG